VIILKKLISILGGLVLTLALVTTVSAKPAGNLAGALKIPWNLSGAVMPVPPYGLSDISGSDTASKLIVNQPNGKVQAMLTGDMKGLTPNTEYTVFLSNGYTPYVFTGWNVSGNWVFRAEYGGSTYNHDMVIDSQTEGTFIGHGGFPAGCVVSSSCSVTETITGTIDVMTGVITMHISYIGSSYTADIVALIGSDGQIIGTWGNMDQGFRNPYYSTSGTATKSHTGDTGWPGLFTNTIQPFTFVTDSLGSGSWHVNLRDADFPTILTSPYNLSVWINGAGGTILISDNFTIVK
jgi:hypothetical protein